MHSARRCRARSTKDPRVACCRTTLRALLALLLVVEAVLVLDHRDRDLERGLDLSDALAQRTHTHLLARAAARAETRRHDLIGDHAELGFEHLAQRGQLPLDVGEERRARLVVLDL